MMFRPVLPRIVTLSVVFRACLLLLVAADASAQTAEWQRVTPPGPPARIEEGWAYDTVNDRAVMFGGYDANWNRLNDTWEFTSTSQTWVDVSPAGARPPRRSGHAMAYDPGSQSVLVFGGYSDAGQYLNDTWRWSTTARTWTQQAPAQSPAARQGARLVYDANRAQLVLFGGVDATGFYADTWVWTGTNWSRLATSASAGFVGKAYPGLAYNAATHKVQLFGGIGFPPTAGQPVQQFDEFWELSGTTWTRVAKSGSWPGARSWTALVYDATRNRTVLYGGYATSFSYGDTWSWNGSAWTQISATSSGPDKAGRDSHAMVWDDVRGTLLLYGGYFSDVWELNNITWSALKTVRWPTPQWRHTFAYDSARSVAALYGGGAPEYWEFTTNAQQWAMFTRSGPGGRVGSAAAFDAARSRFTMFGGQQRTQGALGSFLQDTWTWEPVSTTWASRGGAVKPSPRQDASLTYYPGTQNAVLFGGRSSSGTALGDTWAWNGSAWTSVAVTGPSPRYGHVTAYDPQRGRVVLFGGTNGTQFFGDTWEWNGSSWSQVNVSTTNLTPRAFAALTGLEAGLAGVVLFGGRGAGGLLGDCWMWDGTMWRTVSGSAPTAREGARMTYDLASHRALLYGGADATGPTADLYYLVVRQPSTYPIPVSVTPSSGAGPAQTFTLTVRDPVSASQIRQVLLIANASSATARAAYFWYDGASDLLYLRDDGDTAWTGGVHPGSGGLLSNSQVVVPIVSARVQRSGTDLTLTVPMTFRASFVGTKGLFAWAANASGGGPRFETMGTFTVQSVPPTIVPPAFSFDGDRKADVAVWRPNSGAWLTLLSAGGWSKVDGWGLPTDSVVPADYDGDGKLDYAVWRPGTGQWLILRSAGGWSSTVLGSAGDVPVPADYDGDRRADLAVWRPSTGTWTISLSGGGGTMTVPSWGLPNDVPIAFDFDGDLRADFGLWRPATHGWVMLYSRGGWGSVIWGNVGDQPVPGDYDGDGRTDIAVWRPANGVWFVVLSTGGWTWFQSAGTTGDVAVPGDYDGDGRTDVATWRPSTGVWTILGSAGASLSYTWGLSGDVPITRR